MLPVNSGGHTAYQNFVTKNLRKHYPDPCSLSRSTWDIIERFWALDLSFTDEFLRSKYSVFGPKPRTPSCMQRSYLLSIDFKVDSITDWVAQLKINPLYAILSGFEFGDTPGIGTFYDFFDHLWDSDSDNLSPHEKPVKEKKVKKPKQKGAKANPMEKSSVDQLFLNLDAQTFSIDEQPYASALPLLLPHSRENTVSATVPIEVFWIVTVTATFPNRIVILAGSLPETVFMTAITFICWLPPIRKVISPSFHSCILLPNMIPMLFRKLISR